MIDRFSSLQWEDTIEIVASYNAISKKLFSCGECKKKYPQDARVRMKGCHSPIERPVAVWKNKIHFYKCPSNFYNPMIAELSSHARHIESGLLPYEGGLYDQPAKLIESINLLNSLRIEDEIERLEKQSQEARKELQRAKRNGK
jgi:hypothetical protein